MATRPIGEGTRNITVNIPEDWVAELDALAEKSKMNRNMFLKMIFEEVLENKVHYLPVRQGAMRFDDDAERQRQEAELAAYRAKKAADDLKKLDPSVLKQVDFGMPEGQQVAEEAPKYKLTPEQLERAKEQLLEQGYKDAAEEARKASEESKDLKQAGGESA